MNFEVRLSNEAKDDIIRNMVWWGENHSLAQAVEWEKTVSVQLKTLQDMPERFGYAAENENIELELRQIIVGLGAKPTYRAIYTVGDSVVHILAVRRSAQDEFLPQ